MPESTRQREAFDAHWALGPHRSIETLSAVLRADAGPHGRPPALRTLYGWSSRYRWQARIDALERQAREGLLLQQKRTEWLGEVGPAGAPPETGIRALVEGAKLERLARGEASERLQTKEEDDDEREIFTRFSEAELRLLAEEAERLLARTEPPQPE